jgi:hypothetical protein
VTSTVLVTAGKTSSTVEVGGSGETRSVAMFAWAISGDTVSTGTTTDPAVGTKVGDGKVTDIVGMAKPVATLVGTIDAVADDVHPAQMRITDRSADALTNRWAVRMSLPSGKAGRCLPLRKKIISLRPLGPKILSWHTPPPSATAATSERSINRAP